MSIRDQIRRESSLYSEFEALVWTMKNMLQNSTYPNFSKLFNRAEIETLRRFHNFRISYIYRRQDVMDTEIYLSRTVKAFDRKLYLLFVLFRFAFLDHLKFVLSKIKFGFLQLYITAEKIIRLVI